MFTSMVSPSTTDTTVTVGCVGAEVGAKVGVGLGVAVGVGVGVGVSLGVGVGVEIGAAVGDGVGTAVAVGAQADDKRARSPSSTESPLKCYLLREAATSPSLLT